MKLQLGKKKHHQARENKWLKVCFVKKVVPEIPKQPVSTYGVGCVLPWPHFRSSLLHSQPNVDFCPTKYIFYFTCGDLIKLVLTSFFSKSPIKKCLTWSKVYFLKVWSCYCVCHQSSLRNRLLITLPLESCWATLKEGACILFSLS